MENVQKEKITIMLEPLVVHVTLFEDLVGYKDPIRHNITVDQWYLYTETLRGVLEIAYTSLAHGMFQETTTLRARSYRSFILYSRYSLPIFEFTMRH